MKLVPLGDRVVLKQCVAGDYKVRNRDPWTVQRKTTAGRGYRCRTRRNGKWKRS